MKPTGRLRRWARRFGLGAAILLLFLALPIVWIEGVCRAPNDANVRNVNQASMLADEPGYARPEINSYLSFPEWHIVYIYEDFAGVLSAGDASNFAYGRPIAAFWRGLCELNRIVSNRAESAFGTKVMLYTIGWSITVELALKGAYEETIGRLFEWTRGPEKTPEDIFIEKDADAYAQFLRQAPWYEYPFAARLGAFWRQTPFWGRDLARKVERRVAFSLEYGLKAGYAALIKNATAATLGPAELKIKTVIVGLVPEDLVADPRIQPVRELEPGRTLILTPRYRAYTETIVGLARRGRDITEIAGNDDVLMTVLAPPGALAAGEGARELFTVFIQSRPGIRRIGLDVRVARLAETIRVLESRGIAIEHIYDY